MCIFLLMFLLCVVTHFHLKITFLSPSLSLSPRAARPAQSSYFILYRIKEMYYYLLNISSCPDSFIEMVQLTLECGHRLGVFIITTICFCLAESAEFSINRLLFTS